MEKYNIFNNKDGELLLEVNVGSGTATLLNLNQSLKNDVKEWTFVDLTLEQYQSMMLVEDSSVKQDALNKVCERMKNPTVSEEGWRQVKLFLEGSLGI